MMLSPWIDCAGPCLFPKNCHFKCRNLDTKIQLLNIVVFEFDLHCTEEWIIACTCFRTYPHCTHHCMNKTDP